MQKASIVMRGITLTALLLTSGFLFSCEEKKAEQPAPAPVAQAVPAPAPAPAADTLPPQQATQVPAGQVPAAGTTVASTATQAVPAEELIPEGDPTPPQPLPEREPELVVVPSGDAQVYMAPHRVGVYFYGGHWYRHHHGVWFSAANYWDPWVFVQPTYVPRFVVDIPPYYAYGLPVGYYRIGWNDFHSHWRTWDRDRYWHRQPWYQHERRADIRRDRFRQANTRYRQERVTRENRIRSTRSAQTTKGLSQAQTKAGQTKGLTRAAQNKQMQQQKRQQQMQKKQQLNQTQQQKRQQQMQKKQQLNQTQQQKRQQQMQKKQQLNQTQQNKRQQVQKQQQQKRQQVQKQQQRPQQRQQQRQQQRPQQQRQQQKDKH